MKKKTKRKIFKLITLRPINKFLIIVLNIIKLFNINFIIRLIFRFPVVGKIKVNHNGKKFLMFSDGGDSIATNLYWGGLHEYEPETIDIFDILVQKCDNIFDIGANSGVFSLFCLSSNQNAKVYAFEPVARNYKYLKFNKELNNYNQLSTYDIAVTDFDGKVTFCIPNSITLPLGGSIRNDLEEKMDEFVEVEAMTLDSFVRSNNIKMVDLFKIDTEGTEHKVLQGGIETILKYKPVIICEVLPNLTEKYLMEFFKEINYKYFHITEDGLILKEKIIGDKTLKYHNYLFITEDSISKFNDLKKLMKNVQH